MSSNTYRNALAQAMQKSMEEFEKVLIIGQGVTDFKGLFGTTLGLAEKYPSRVIETPLAEDSIAGICLGASLNGMYPINTHIRAITPSPHTGISCDYAVKPTKCFGKL